MATLSCLDGIDVADHVRYCYIGSCKLLHIAINSAAVFDWCLFSEFQNQVAATAADRVERIVVDLATRDHWHGFIQQRCQLAKNAALGLASQTEKDHVVARKNRIDNLRHYRIFISDNSGENR